MIRNPVFDSCTDEELILRLRRDGERGIEEYLMERYKQMVRSLARALFLAGGDQEDLLQEGMLGLFRAIRDYDPSREASFRTYARLLVQRQMYSAILSAQRQKHQPLNQSLSIDEMEDNRQDAELGEAASPENIILEQENIRDLRERIDEVLSPMEREVLALYMEGMDYRQIAEHMKKPHKSIDNALQRIRTKASHLWEEYV